MCANSSGRTILQFRRTPGVISVDHDYKTAGDIIADLVDIVSKNGALLLNVGPRADGTIPEVEQEMLREIGRWLQVNGEGIYETRPWQIFGEGPTPVPEGAFTDTAREAFTAADIRFTRKGNTLYAYLAGAIRKARGADHSP